LEAAELLPEDLEAKPKQEEREPDLGCGAAVDQCAVPSPAVVG